MAERAISIPIAGSNPVSGVIHAPRTRAKRSGVAVVLAHGAGNDMNAPLVVDVAERLLARGHTVLRFNFVYKELGRKAPDRPPLLEKAYEAAIARMLEDRPERLVIGGKSMGGRVASLLAARGVRADGLLFLGYPLHPAGKRAPLRDAHLPAIVAPLLFLQGTRDPLCDLGLLRPVLKRLGQRATLHVIEGGDHSLDLLKSAGRTRESVLEEIDVAIDGWLKARVLPARPKAP
ncbi:alpha/beta hydrolase family protein [Sorangium sp. So ce1000]|uniref:alpha/beta hydrolase family protein n=1 Tax=Sorangium sp. So ce1000 TaxID=3133325 RepID=UPI003F61F981